MEPVTSLGAGVVFEAKGLEKDVSANRPVSELQPAALKANNAGTTNRRREPDNSTSTDMILLTHTQTHLRMSELTRLE
jgi:hypothetical protein